MSRAIWKGPYINSCILKQKKINPKIWSRSSTIPSFLVGAIVSVYNGQEFKRIIITRKRVGFKFGEFSLTRKFRKKVKSNKIASKK